MFINFMCEPDIGKANAEYIGYTTPMESVREILDEDLADSEIAFPPEEVEAKEKVFTALSDEVNELTSRWSEMEELQTRARSCHLFRAAAHGWWHWFLHCHLHQGPPPQPQHVLIQRPLFLQAALQKAQPVFGLQREKENQWNAENIQRR